jgi:hypothetical protein
MADDVAKKEFKLFIAGKLLDITSMPPLTMRDKRVLKERGIPISAMSTYTPEQEVEFLQYVLAKVDKEITKDHVEELPIGIASDVFIHVGNVTSEARQERPT